EEMFSRGMFPPIGERPYPLTLGPHSFYWFALVPPRSGRRSPSASGGHLELPFFPRVGTWEQLLHESNKWRLEALLPAFLARRRMMAGPGTIRSATVADILPGAIDAVDARFLIIRLEHDDADPETILLPLVRVTDDQAAHLIEPLPAA